MDINNKLPAIVVFDFDGTLTKSDSLFSFIIFTHGFLRLFFGLIYLSPSLILYKLGFLDNQIAKERLITYFYSGWNESDFNHFGKSFTDKINRILKKDSLSAISFHQDMGHELVIVSASFENWIKPWANSVGIKHVLASKLAVSDKKVVTGKISGRNCYGSEKVKRFLEVFPDRNSYTLIVYGDSAGDREIMAIADFSFYQLNGFIKQV